MLRIQGNQFDDAGWQQTTPTADVQFHNRLIRKSVGKDVELLCGVSEHKVLLAVVVCLCPCFELLNSK